MMRPWKAFQPYLLVAPQTLVLLLFLVLPIALIVIVSFWNFNGFAMTPGFTLSNYLGIFSSKVYLATYLNTFKFAAIVWLVCLLISYPVAYFLSFHIKSSQWQTIWFLVCTIPFLTSNIIRMISWIPFLGREGLLNQAQWYSSALAGHLTWTLPFAFLIMLGIFGRFNPAYEEAARDLGANDVTTFWQIVFPLIAASVIGVGLLGFTLPYDEFTRTSLISGETNTLPLEIFGMTTNVTSPALYALGTLTTIFSFALIGVAITAIQFLSRQQTQGK